LTIRFWVGRLKYVWVVWSKIALTKRWYGLWGRAAIFSIIARY
jgi:hypothetical protein